MKRNGIIGYDWIDGKPAAIRKQVITATDMVGLTRDLQLTSPPNWVPTPMEIYADKLGLLEEKPVTQGMQIGSLAEEVIAKKFSADKGFKVVHPKKTYVNSKYPFMGCSPDGFLYKPKGRKLIGGLECKKVRYSERSRWQDPKEGGDAAFHVIIQAVVCNIVMDAPCWYIAAWIDDDFWYYKVERDLKFEGIIIQRAEEFHRIVLEKKWEFGVPIDDTKAYGEIIRRITPAIVQECVAANSNMVTAYEKYCAIDAELKKLESQRQFLRNCVEKVMLGAKTMVDPNSGAILWRYVEKAGGPVSYIRKPTRELRIIKQE